MALLYRLSGAVAPITRRASVVPRVLASPLPQRSQLLRTAHTTTTSSSGAHAMEDQQPPVSNGSDRVYSDFHIYKARAAMCMRMLPPTFVDRTDGSKFRDRDGVLLLEFANANPAPPGAPPPQTAGSINRTYNWGKKVLFALSTTELGNILAGDMIETKNGLVLFHDPVKLGKTDEPLKRLTIKRMEDGAINFNMNAGPDNISMPVSKGEFEVFKSIAHYAIPRLLGFNTFFSS